VTVPVADDSTEEEEHDADCVFFIGRLSEDHSVEKWMRCAKYFRWAHTLCVGMEEDFVVSLTYLLHGAESFLRS
jgi:hypothetical protein